MGQSREGGGDGEEDGGWKGGRESGGTRHREGVREKEGGEGRREGQGREIGDKVL